MITILSLLNTLTTLLVDALVYVFPRSFSSLIAGALHGLARIMDYGIHKSRRDLDPEMKEALSRKDNLRAARIRELFPVPQIEIEEVLVICQDAKHDDVEIRGTSVRNAMIIRVPGGGKALSATVREGVRVGVFKGATTVRLYGHDGCAADAASSNDAGRTFLPVTTAAILNYDEDFQLLLKELRNETCHKVRIVTGNINTITGRETDIHSHWIT